MPVVLNPALRVTWGGRSSSRHHTRSNASSAAGAPMHFHEIMNMHQLRLQSQLSTDTSQAACLAAALSLPRQQSLLPHQHSLLPHQHSLLSHHGSLPLRGLSKQLSIASYAPAAAEDGAGADEDGSSSAFFGAVAKGDRAFLQGRWEEAEMAYKEAQPLTHGHIIAVSKTASGS